ncbi:MAG: 16S rRNA (guanine(527)-N(7))-methyltransferase RsmG, partial [Anaerovoracaceae bacterium]
KQFILMDSLKKRLNIIDELTSSIGIRNVSTVHARAEELARNKEHREQYDLCVSRAVANLATLSEYCLPFIRQGGYLLAYKGPDAEEEIAQAKKAIFLLGGQLERVESAPLNRYGLDHRILFIKKVRNTPAKYPRKAGTPSKDPLK